MKETPIDDTNTIIGSCGYCKRDICYIKDHKCIMKALYTGNGGMLYFGYICPDCGVITEISYSSNLSRDEAEDYLKQINAYNVDITRIR